MLRRPLLAIAATLPLLLLLLPYPTSAQDSTIIWEDYTNPWWIMLPAPSVNAIANPHVYNTNQAAGFRFGVDWNNDAQDQFTITTPSTVTVTSTNDQAFCTPNPNTHPPNQITFTFTSPHQCNYSVNWTQPFSGVMTVTYNGGPNTDNIRSNAVSIFFTNASVIGDPQFVGLRGQTYQVHGIDGAVYNLISDRNLQVNARFVFLSKGDCAVIDGVRVDGNCWSHPGTYLGEMSFQQVVDGKLHAALISAGSAEQGFSTVQVDGKALQLSNKVSFGSFSVELTSSHSVRVSTTLFDFDLTNSDRFINQGLHSKVALSQLRSHGLLGQTHSSNTHASPLRYIEGDVDDYAIFDGDLFGDGFVFNRFLQ